MATTPSTRNGLTTWFCRLWPGLSRREPSPRRVATAAMAQAGRSRRVPRWVAWLAVLLLAAAAAIAVALRVTPLQTVSVAGQVIKVGATAPTLSLSGPGEIDLFGQSFPTNLHFLGPVRPRLQLA